MRKRGLIHAAFGASQVCGSGGTGAALKKVLGPALAGFFSAIRCRAAVIFKGLQDQDCQAESVLEQIY
jgi:hypothetical protein